MQMVVYQGYISGSGNTASITTSGKGKIVAIAWSSALVGGAAVGSMCLLWCHNSVPAVTGLAAVNGPQKQLILMNQTYETAITTSQSEHDSISGLAIDYNSGDTFQGIASSIGGTAATTFITMVQFYCMEQ